MPEERKEMWTTLIRKGDDSGFNLRRARKITEVYDDISLYTPKYLPAGSMGYDSRTLLYTLTKPIKVRNSDGSFTVYDVPEFAVEGVYIPLAKPKVETIANLVTLNQLSAIPVLLLPVLSTITTKVLNDNSALVSTTTKSKPIVKQPVPLALLPHVANVSSNGIIFFNLPDGYTNDLFMAAVKAVTQSNPELLEKPIPLYELPQLLVLKQRKQQLMLLWSWPLYKKHRDWINLLLNIKLPTAFNIKTNKDNNILKPHLVAEMFAYPSRVVDVYNMHPEVYLKALELLLAQSPEVNINKERLDYVVSPYGLEKVSIGGEVNDSIYHYVSKNGEETMLYRGYESNPYLLNPNEPSTKAFLKKTNVTDDKKTNLYYSGKNSFGMTNLEGGTPYHVNNLILYKKLYDNRKIRDLEFKLSKKQLMDDNGLDELQAEDYLEKNNYNLIEYEPFEDYQSIFHPIEEELPALSNIAQKAKNIASSAVQKGKQAAKKVLSIFGFLNGGQLKYYKNGK